MDTIASLFEAVDSFLIAPYRWTGNPVVGWWLGTSLLALWSTLLGEITGAFASRASRSRVLGINQEMMDRHRQSMNALQAGDKEAYKAINRLANEAYGNTFFLHMALACSSLWPVALALGWLQSRFSGIEFRLPLRFPLVGESVGYAFVFIPLYILWRIIFGKVRHYLPFFKAI